MTCTALRNRLNQHLAKYDQACSQLDKEETELQRIKDHINEVEQAQKIIQIVAEAIQQKAHQQIAEVVSSCLAAVFEEDAYEFKIEFVQRRGKTEANLLLERDGLVVDPLRAAGGGVVDVVSFALRLACLLLSCPRKRALLVLDEPFKMLDASRVPLVGELLLRLSKEQKIQIIMVTHNSKLRIGKVIDLKGYGSLDIDDLDGDT